MPVTDTTTFRIFDTSVGVWKNITALSLKNDVADPLDWLIIYDGTTDNQWERVDPTGFKALTAATDYALAVDTSEKVPGTLLEAYFGGGIPANTWSIDIDTADASWTLQTNSTCTVDVDWGDGNSEQLVLTGDTDTTHLYAAPGQYTVTLTLVSGVFRPYFSNPEADIVALNGTGAGWSFGTSLLSAFRGQYNLTNVSPDMDISSVESLSNTWRNCSLTSFPALNTSSVTSMVYTWTNNALTEFSLIDTSLVGSVSHAWFGNAQLVDFPLLNLSASGDFPNAWGNCNLSAASIENITQALIANGRSNLTTTINGTTYDDWTAQAQADYVELTTNRGWTIITS
jgi:hypothetical protein